MVKDHLSATNLPVSFPQFPLKGKPAVAGKSPKHLSTEMQHTSRTQAQKQGRQLLLWSHEASSTAETRVLIILVKLDSEDVLCVFLAGQCQ